MKTNIFTKAVVFILMITILCSLIISCDNFKEVDEVSKEKALFEAWDNLINDMDVKIECIEFYDLIAVGSLSGADVKKDVVSDSEQILNFINSLRKNDILFEKLEYNDQDAFKEYMPKSFGKRVIIRMQDDKEITITICTDGYVYLNGYASSNDSENDDTIVEYPDIIDENEIVYEGCFYRSKNKVSYDEIFDIFKNK